MSVAEHQKLHSPTSAQHTQVVPEGGVQQSEQRAELEQLRLHALHLLLKVLVLRHTRGTLSWVDLPRPAAADSHRTHHLVHDGNKAPECIHLVFHDVEDGGEQVAHALDVTWRTDTQEHMKLLHQVPHLI